MMIMTRIRFVPIAIFAISLMLRLGLTLINREANDDHIEVVQKVVEAVLLPTMEQCRECFHPKLFYVTAAGLLQLLPAADLDTQIISIQLLNFVAGAITLIVVYKFIWEYPSEDQLLKSLIFALVALNPKLIAIHSQASNDTFVILFSTLALYFAYHFLQGPTPKLLVFIILFLLLAVSTKVMGWITFVSICVCFLVSILGSEKKRSMALYTLILMVTVILLSVLNPLSQIVANTQKFGTPVVNSRQRLPLPAFFHPTYKYKKHYFRPGIVSIQDGFLTFRFIDLLKVPRISNEPDEFSPQRTSFWTMLYADSNSLHFQNWPPSWQTQGVENFNTSRAIFIFALLPVFVIFTGFLRELIDFLKSLLHWKMFKSGDLLFLVNFCGNITFLMLAALLYRDFGFIKLVYILPGLLSFIWMILRGMEVIFHGSPRQAFLRPRSLVSGWVTVLCVFYLLDVLAMISQLYAVNVNPFLANSS